MRFAAWTYLGHGGKIYSTIFTAYDISCFFSTLLSPCYHGGDNFQRGILYIKASHPVHLHCQATVRFWKACKMWNKGQNKFSKIQCPFNNWRWSLWDYQKFSPDCMMNNTVDRHTVLVNLHRKKYHDISRFRPPFFDCPFAMFHETIMEPGRFKGGANDDKNELRRESDLLSWASRARPSPNRWWWVVTWLRTEDIVREWLQKIMQL